MTTRADRLAALPPSLAPRGLSRVEAAAYVGVSPTKFDEMVGDGRMPPAKRADARRIWDRLALDAAFAALPDEGADGKTATAGGQSDRWSATV
ncbi:MAG: hypothetical protein NW217_13245 [Hyphomicrobiaceae bacterium]|nr:hypothetical protein [Hyphomicrobiaceae bacterium]